MTPWEYNKRQRQKATNNNTKQTLRLAIYGVYVYGSNNNKNTVAGAKHECTQCCAALKYA